MTAVSSSGTYILRIKYVVCEDCILFSSAESKLFNSKRSLLAFTHLSKKLHPRGTWNIETSRLGLTTEVAAAKVFPVVPL
jgi:hypothetical protein